MKTVIQPILKFAVAATLAAAVSTATAQISPIRISVNVTGHTDTERAKAPKKGGIIPKTTVTQDKQLEITLANGTPTDYKDLTVKYFLFIKDLTSKEISIPRLGKQNIDLPSLGSVKIKSETLVVTHTEQYSKKSQGEIAFVPEKGEKYLGYGVQVLRGDALVAETFEPPDLKTKLGTTWIEPVGGKKKSKKY
jgi:hypothetical protein